MSADSDHQDTEPDTVAHAPEGSVFTWPEFELNSTFEPLESEEQLVYYFYPREASDEVIEREWIMAMSDVVVDVADIR